MKITLMRVSYMVDCVFGTLIDSITGMPICNTLERPMRNNESGESCIPAGVYVCSFYSGDKHKNVYMVNDVPGREAILIHIGNTVKDTTGCILPGQEFGVLNGLPAVLQSKVAMTKLHNIVKRSDFLLEIKG